MCNIRSYFLWALAVCTLCHGSLAKDPQSSFVCFIDEPHTNQYESNCNCQDAGIQEKLSSQGVQQAKIKGQLQAVQTKLEESLDNLERSLLAVQTELKNQLQEVLSKLEIQNQLQAVPNKMEESQQATKMKDSDPDRNTIPSGFERIGTRYLRIVNEQVDEREAEKKCEELGGFLATYLLEGEFDLITTKLLKGNPNQDCTVRGFTDGLWTDYCNNRHYFICVADI